MTVHRMIAPLGKAFLAPKMVTFGYQQAREEFSLWYDSEASPDATYIVVGTGHDSPPYGPWELVATAVMPDGYHVLHLLRQVTP